MKSGGFGQKLQQNNAAESKVTSSLPRLFIDTNILLELEFQDERWLECRDLLKKIETGEIKASTSDFVVYGSILEIESKERGKSAAKISTFLTALSSLKGLSVFRPTVTEMIDASETMKRRKLDFDDSYIVSSMKAEDVRTLVSFDRHFDKQSEIERLEPNQILESIAPEKTF
jgi:predicted nucleic acid-binding protein